VHNLALELERRGHYARIVTGRMRGAGLDVPFVRRVGRSVVIYANGGVSRLTVGWRLVEQLTRLFRKEKFDVIHVHGGIAFTFGVVAPFAAWRAGIPVIATFHSWFPRSMLYRIFQRPLQRMLDRHARLLAVSPSVVTALSRYFRGHWDIVPNGVNLAAFHPNGRPPADARAESAELLFLHRLEPRNGVGTVLDAMPRILERFPTARLTVVGDGPLRAHYESRTRPLGDRVRFLGVVPGEARPDLYRGADLYLCPSVRGSFGVTLLEAMACGTPMVLADGPGFRSVVQDGCEGVMVPPRDPAAWADATIALLGDPARRAAMREAGLLTAARYAWPRVADQTLAVYEQVVRSSEQRPLSA
jgi:phosphatidylinositol alpha-mannosyltransferase